MIGSEYVDMARPEKVWCLLNGSAGHDVDARSMVESRYEQDLDDLIEAKTAVAELLVDYYTGSDDSVEDVRNIEIPYQENLIERKEEEGIEDQIDAVERLLSTSTDKKELLIAGRDAVSFYQEALGYKMKEENPETDLSDSRFENVETAADRVEDLAWYAEEKGNPVMAGLIRSSINSNKDQEIQSLAEEGPWKVNPGDVDDVDLRIWSRSQLEGPPFQKYPRPEEVLEGDFEGEEIEYSWDIASGKLSGGSDG